MMDTEPSKIALPDNGQSDDLLSLLAALRAGVTTPDQAAKVFDFVLRELVRPHHQSVFWGIACSPWISPPNFAMSKCSVLPCSTPTVQRAAINMNLLTGLPGATTRSFRAAGFLCHEAMSRRSRRVRQACRRWCLHTRPAARVSRIRLRERLTVRRSGV